MEPTIKKAVHDLSTLLSAKTVGKTELSAESDRILAPLLDLIDGKLSQFAQYCERTVMKRLLKELWKIVITTMERTIVLPPVSEKNMILGSLPNAKIEDVSRLFRNHVTANKLPSLGVVEVSRDASTHAHTITPPPCTCIYLFTATI